LKPGRTDPAFRKQIKKEGKRQARAAREEAEQEKLNARAAIKQAVQEAQVEGFPTDVEEKEAYFMQEVSRGEALSGEGTKSDIETQGSNHNLTQHRHQQY
jgi:mitochondrial import receptor subunit TOM20